MEPFDGFLAFLSLSGSTGGWAEGVRGEEGCHLTRTILAGLQCSGLSTQLKLPLSVGMLLGVLGDGPCSKGFSPLTLMDAPLLLAILCNFFFSLWESDI